MNFLGGFVILLAAYLLAATQATEFRYSIASVVSNGAAASIGFKPGDVVQSVNGVDMTQRLAVGASAENSEAAYAPFRAQARQSIGGKFSAVVLRRDETDAGGKKLVAVPIQGTIPASANPQAPLGVGIGRQVTKSERMALSIPQAASAALNDIGSVLVGFFRAPIDLIQQRVPAELARPVSVVGITSIGVSLIEERESQGLFPFIRFAAFISIILGLTNLLPIPALDGGRILFILIEAVRGKRVDPQREQWVHAIGMILLLGLSAAIIVLDIVNPISLR
jgi:regulator of sigma E protease